MYNVRTITALSIVTRHFDDVNEAVAYCHSLIKAYRNFDVYKDGTLIATGNRDGIYPVRRVKKQLHGGKGYANMMAERRV